MNKQQNNIKISDAVDAWSSYIEKFGMTKIGVSELFNRGYSAKMIYDMFTAAVETNIPLDMKNL